MSRVISRASSGAPRTIVLPSVTERGESATDGEGPLSFYEFQQATRGFTGVLCVEALYQRRMRGPDAVLSSEDRDSALPSYEDAMACAGSYYASPPSYDASPPSYEDAMTDQLSGDPDCFLSNADRELLLASADPSQSNDVRTPQIYRSPMLDTSERESFAKAICRRMRAHPRVGAYLCLAGSSLLLAVACTITLAPWCLCFLVPLAFFLFVAYMYFWIQVGVPDGTALGVRQSRS